MLSDRDRQRQRNLCPRDRVWVNDAQRTCCRAGLLCLCMFPPSAVGTSEITITIHHGPGMHQMRAARVRMAARVGLLDPPTLASKWLYGL